MRLRVDFFTLLTIFNGFCAPLGRPGAPQGDLRAPSGTKKDTKSAEWTSKWRPGGLREPDAVPPLRNRSDCTKTPRLCSTICPLKKGAQPLGCTPPLPPRTPPSQLRTLREQCHKPAAAGKARAFRNIYIYIYICIILYAIILDQMISYYIVSYHIISYHIIFRKALALPAATGL